MKKVEIYTDGACSNNTGKGGWAAILIYNGHEKVISGGELDTTNNRMELKSIIEALKILKEKCEVTIYSDSAYAINPFIKNWIYDWIKNNWKNSEKNEIKNVDLWKLLLEQVNSHIVSFVKVKGHSDNEFNNRCDKLARKEISLL